MDPLQNLLTNFAIMAQTIVKPIKKIQPPTAKEKSYPVNPHKYKR